MSQTFKRILAVVGAFFAGVLAGVCALLRHRGPAGAVGELISEEQRGIAEAHDRVRDAQGTADEIDRTVEAIGRSARELGANELQIEEILKRIRTEQQMPDNNL